MMNVHKVVVNALPCWLENCIMKSGIKLQQIKVSFFNYNTPQAQQLPSGPQALRSNFICRHLAPAFYQQSYCIYVFNRP
jgi:hypothetical protein